MTLNQIHYFVEIARFENYHLAAESLHISQPSLSRAMTFLEEELKTTLFEKKGRGIALTKAGSVFLEQALAIEKAYEKALQTMKEISSGLGTINLGYVFPLAKEFIPTCISQFLKEMGNEDITFSLHQKSSSELIKQVQKGDLDVGFGFYIENTDLDTYPIFSFSLMAIFPIDHPLAQKKEVFLSDLAQWPMIGYEKSSYMAVVLERLYNQHQIQPTFLALCPDEYSIFSLVQKNVGVALILADPYQNLDNLKGIELRKIEDVKINLQVEMFWNYKRKQLPVVERFLSFIQRRFQY